MQLVKGFDIMDAFDFFGSASVEESEKQKLIKTVFSYSMFGIISIVMGIFFSYNVLSNVELYSEKFPLILVLFKSMNRLFTTYFLTSSLFLLLARFKPELEVLNIVGIFISNFVAGIFIFFPIRAVIVLKTLANLDDKVYTLTFLFITLMILAPFLISLFSKTRYNVGLNALITILVGVSLMFIFDWNFVVGFKSWIFTSLIFLIIFQILIFFIFNMILKSDVYDKCPASAALLLLNCISGIILSILIIVISLIILLGGLFFAGKLSGD